ASGEHAPGRREPVASLAAAHHLMLGHGLATEAIHARSASSHVGVGLNFYPTYPASAAAADLDAARRIDGMQNRLFADAIFKGGYPSDVLEDLSAISDLKFIRDADAAVISAPTDMLCVNYYSRYTVTGRRGGQASASAAPVDAGSPWPANEHVGFVDSGLETTGMSWEIDPDGLRAQLVRLSRDYPGVPLVVTENGSAFDDEVEADAVHDVERRDYLASHLDACAAALAEGAPLRGYFTWSLMDNFEWAWGYTKRFGIVHVDFDTQRRIVKDSGRWYAEEITRNTRGLSGRL
ncbi:MAG: glycoside hydrolase family 1 protein, partial [Stackebrandtia sp.]